MDTEPVSLLPNIGAEESHRDHTKLAQHPTVVHLGELWLASMGSSGAFHTPGEASAAGPLSAWANTGNGLLPWFGSESSEQQAYQSKLVHIGPKAKYVQNVHNKGFAAKLAKLIEHNNGWEYSHIIDKINGPDDAKQILNTILESWPDWAKANFTLKPCMGSAGRGRIAGKNSQLSTQHFQGLYKMTLRGGAIIEPWYSTVENLSTQLVISKDGTHKLLGHTSQILTPSGTYLGNHGILKSGHICSGTDQDDKLKTIANALTSFISQQGFYGVCGFDSFTFVCPLSGETKLRSPLEINARFTSATVGISHVQEIAAEHKCEHGSWVFILDAKEDWCAYAKEQQTWRVKVITTPTTQKSALIAIAPDAGSLKHWLETIGLKT